MSNDTALVIITVAAIYFIVLIAIITRIVRGANNLHGRVPRPHGDEEATHGDQP